MPWKYLGFNQPTTKSAVADNGVVAAKDAHTAKLNEAARHLIEAESILSDLASQVRTKPHEHQVILAPLILVRQAMSKIPKK